MSNTPLAWFAGVMEGEGSITVTRSGGGRSISLLVQVTNTDLEMLHPFKARWGGYIYQRKVVNPNHKPVHLYKIRADRAAAVLSELLPYLQTNRTREKALLAISFQALSIVKRLKITTDVLTTFRRLNRRGVAA